MAFAPEEIEDGYGLPGALVYEQTEDAVAWLSRRGHTALQDLEYEDDQDTALLLATEAAEGAVREFLRCVPIDPAQGLLFPARGAYGSNGQMFGEGEKPGLYMQGIRLLAEHIAAGTFMRRKAAGPPVGIEEEGSRQGRIKYREGVDFTRLSTNHPEEWRLISSVVPAL